MNLGDRRSSARVLLIGVGVACVLGHARPAQADEPVPGATATATAPKVFEGWAGFARFAGFTWAAGATISGVILAVKSAGHADRAFTLAAPVSRDLGPGACRTPSAARATACANLGAALADRDETANFAAGLLVFAGVASVAATASIWLWRTPATTYRIPALWGVTPTAGPKSGGVILQGSW
jgi:hypothetical protein